jgi:hypothetical protein
MRQVSETTQKTEKLETKMKIGSAKNLPRQKITANLAESPLNKLFCDE